MIETAIQVKGPRQNKMGIKIIREQTATGRVVP